MLIHHVVQKQKLAEGQEIAEAVLDAEVRLGELRKSVERKEYHGGRMGAPQGVSIKTPLASFDESAGLTRRIAPQIEAIASHPDLVERVKAEKREAGEIVTRQDVLNAIKAEEQAPREPQAPQEAGMNVLLVHGSDQHECSAGSWITAGMDTMLVRGSSVKGTLPRPPEGHQEATGAALAASEDVFYHQEN